MQQRIYQVMAIMGLSCSLAAAEAPLPPPGDFLSQGVWWLYQAQYDHALKLFDKQVAAHPEDPSGYFYKAATDWWHLAQESDYVLPDIEKRFNENVDLAIEKAKVLSGSTKDPKLKGHAYLYWGGAEGLRGRLYIAQTHWVKAYFTGKSGHAYLHLALKNDPDLYDTYLGLGIYDYYADTLPGVIGVLSALFIRGDRERGLLELQLAIEKGKYARHEAMVFLVEIYSEQEKQPAKALEIAKELRDLYPSSPAMHMMEITALYFLQDWNNLRREAKDFLEKSTLEEPYYTRRGIRPSRYLAGLAAMYGENDYETAFRDFNQNIEEGIDPSRWITFSLLRRGQIYDLRGEREKALADYRLVLDRPDTWGSQEETKPFLKKPYTR